MRVNKMIVQEEWQHKTHFELGYETETLTGIIWEHYPHGGSKLVILLALARDAFDDTGSMSEIHMTDLANICRMDLRNLQRGMRELLDEGVIEPNSGNRGGHGQPNSYIFNVDLIRSMSRQNKAQKLQSKYLKPQIRAAVFQRDGHQCRHCSAKSPLTIDHIIPQSKGGSDEICNLQTLCRSCNSKKGVRV